jgi:hypothetical protein
LPVIAIYNDEFQFVETTFTETLTPDDLLEEIRLYLELLSKHDCSSILSDVTKVKDIKISTIDVYNLPSIQLSAGSSRAYKNALIPPDTKLGREICRFYETVSINRGWKVKVCQTRKEAIDWLTAS